MHRVASHVGFYQKNIGLIDYNCTCWLNVSNQINHYNQVD
jgi:hypothetical protein